MGAAAVAAEPADLFNARMVVLNLDHGSGSPPRLPPTVGTVVAKNCSSMRTTPRALFVPAPDRRAR